MSAVKIPSNDAERSMTIEGRRVERVTYRFQLWVSCPRASVSSMFQELSTNFETTRKLTFGRP